MVRKDVFSLEGTKKKKSFLRFFGDSNFKIDLHNFFSTTLCQTFESWPSRQSGLMLQFRSSIHVELDSEYTWHMPATTSLTTIATGVPSMYVTDEGCNFVVEDCFALNCNLSSILIFPNKRTELQSYRVTE